MWKVIFWLLLINIAVIAAWSYLIPKVLCLDTIKSLGVRTYTEL